MTREMNDPDIDEVHEVRREISARYNHDLAQIARHYMALERNDPNQSRYSRPPLVEANRTPPDSARD